MSSDVAAHFVWPSARLGRPAGARQMMSRSWDQTVVLAHLQLQLPKGQTDGRTDGQLTGSRAAICAPQLTSRPRLEQPLKRFLRQLLVFILPTRVDSIEFKASKLRPATCRATTRRSFNSHAPAATFCRARSLSLSLSRRPCLLVPARGRSGPQMGANGREQWKSAPASLHLLLVAAGARKVWPRRNLLCVAQLARRKLMSRLNQQFFSLSLSLSFYPPPSCPPPSSDNLLAHLESAD